MRVRHRVRSCKNRSRSSRGAGPRGSGRDRRALDVFHREVGAPSGVRRRRAAWRCSGAAVRARICRSVRNRSRNGSLAPSAARMSFRATRCSYCSSARTARSPNPCRLRPAGGESGKGRRAGRAQGWTRAATCDAAASTGLCRNPREWSAAPRRDSSCCFERGVALAGPFQPARAIGGVDLQRGVEELIEPPPTVGTGCRLHD